MFWLISASLRFRLLVVALSVVLIVIGVRSADQIPLDVFPEFAPPLVEIQTEAPGLSTEEVESLVSVPIENSLTGIPYVRTVRSKSVLGLSSIRLIFEPGTDLLVARQLVQERLTLAAGRLPQVVKPPVILPPLSSLSRAMKIGMTSPTQSQMDMTVLAKWTIRPRLMSINGVANVAIWGEKDRQFQVLIDPDRLQAHGVTLDMITQAVRTSAVVGSGGFIDTPNQRLAIRHVSPMFGPQDLEQVAVAFHAGSPLLLGDVAEVVVSYPPPIGDAIINSVPGLMLIVEKQPWANTLDVTREVEAVMKDIQPGLGDVAIDTTIFRPATFIERSLHNLTESLIIGCFLVTVVLLLFLFDWRAALISATAIPLSLLASVLVLYYRGGTINTMVLAGMVIALGEVVDDAIIDVENIIRRLRLNQRLATPESAFHVVLQASLEVRSAVVYASLIVVLAFLPVFFLEGLAGSFFRPLAASYVLAIMVSLVVALTVTPALSLMLLPGAIGRRMDAPLVRLLKRVYLPVLRTIVAVPWLSVLVVLMTYGVGAWAIPRLGEELLPKFKETDFLMHWVEKPGIGIEAMDRITIRASEELRSIPGVRNFGSHIGRAEVADEVVGPNFTELWISVDESADYDKTVATIQEVVDGYPGLDRDLLTYLTERIKEVISGTSATIVVRIFGPNLDELRATAQRVAAEIKPVEGVTTLKVEPQVLVPQIVVRLNPDAASRFGLTAGRVLTAASTLVSGLKVGEIYDDQKIFSIVVWGQPQIRRDVAALQRLMIDIPTGGQVPLGDIADISIEPSANVIQREGASRRIDVSCNVDGRDLGVVAREIEDRVLDNVTFGAGYHPEFLGEYAESQASLWRILGLSALVFVGILVLLHVDFRSVRIVLLVFLTLPFALLGGVAGAFLCGGVISLGSLVGFVTVLGIATRNAIMLLDHYRHLRREEGVAFGIELITRGAEERLAPILMTALTTALALLPLLYAGSRPGNEIEYPMAFVIFGGLIAATSLNLFLMPALFRLVGNVEWRKDEE